ncbi:hypothetical protein LTR56_020133 [Elasticomyces elasticus]|nr:hypothetical protein LTR56_020133 [Elasticomyces elasticus]KAK3633595.1 hypothetical protein LTR22_020031 [Elasticomyces elasticus]KAK4910796.1 hypothetical protein LTR49_020570 [Elasticomyces elasticus]KAK5760442.1 hypothetical protein LTS12_009486 [Elasticomyces elasticus]
MTTAMTSTTMGANAANGKTFFDLPPEIRNTIYALALDLERSRVACYRLIVVYCPETSKPYMTTIPKMPGLVNTCLQIAQETMAMFYNLHRFKFKHPIDDSLLSAARGRIAKKHIKHIVIETEKSNYFGLVIETEGSSLKIWSKGSGECICGLATALRVDGVQKRDDSNGDMSLAFAAAQCFFDKHLPLLQDEFVCKTASWHRRNECKKTKYVYKRDDFTGPWSLD